MITPDGKHATVQGIVVWDGITKPDMDTPVGKPKWSCKIVFHPQQADLADFTTIATNELNAGEFRGQLPPGANWAIGQVNAGDKFNLDGRFDGYVCINAGTYQGAPQVYDVNGQLLDPMAYGQLLYAGCVVDLLLNAYTYNNKQKGVAAGLSGVRIVDATTERLAVGGIDAGTVFGAGAQTMSAPPNVAAPGLAAQTAPGVPAVAPVTAPVQAAPVASPAVAPVAGSPVAVAPAQNYLP